MVESGIYQEIICKLHDTKKNGVKMGLERMKKWLGFFGRPDLLSKVIHIAGTNGKGSTSMTLAYLLNSLGLKVGLYTSPYILKMEERIRVFQPYSLKTQSDALTKGHISEQELVENYLKLQEKVPMLGEEPTFFEWLTAIAWLHFAKEKCDIVILEVGLGGRLDATNTIEKPDLTVITSLGYDHTAYLGNTLVDILAEKCGILKENAPCVALYPTNIFKKDPTFLAEAEEAFHFLEKTTEKMNIPFYPIHYAEIKNQNINREEKLQGFTFQVLPHWQTSNWQTSLLGIHQTWNTALALKALAIWLDLPTTKRDFANLFMSFSQSELEKKLFEQLKNIKWPGRVDYFTSNNNSHCQGILLDGAHNEEGALVLKNTLNILYNNTKIDMVCGILEDKPIAKMLATMLADNSYLIDNFYIVSPSIKGRSLPELELFERFKPYLKDVAKVHIKTDLHFLKQYWNEKNSLFPKEKSNDLIIWGSLYLVGDVYQYLTDLAKKSDFKQMQP